MDSKDIRQKFLDFFGKNDHTIAPSSPLVPIGDPTLLFTNAGMNQFKDYFLGKTDPPYNRATSAQKCMRVSGKHNDLEDVGRDGTHHTFFEMMGNWSFGDYFKNEAIEMAWELITKGFGLDQDRLWATVYKDDDEAERIWRRILPRDRILRCGDKENFWEMAEVGPCGPCSEIHYDLGIGEGKKPNDPGGRFVEIWNLVFMQYFRDQNRNLSNLPQQHVDTGLGLERLVAILQGADENYETDLFLPIIGRIEELTGADFENPEHRIALRVMADHIRALAFAIADGALPGNEGRGYVLRRILRRASRYSRKLGYPRTILHRLVAPLTDTMGDTYPELLQRNKHVVRVIRAEEERFAQTLDIGIEIFEDLAQKAIDDGSRTIWGKDAFKLYDTYGFPLDLTELMASDAGLVVDHMGFDKEMEKQRERARAAGSFNIEHELGKEEWIERSSGPDSIFLGYHKFKSNAKIRKYQFLTDGRIRIILDQTTFYAESGGQVGDTGKIVGEGWEIEVEDTIKEFESIIHIGKLEGDIGENLNCETQIDVQRRKAIMRNHTATHLLHFALRKVIGEHVHQGGSMVAPDRMRFDYTHFEALSKKQLKKVERIVNEVILSNLPVCAAEKEYRQALEEGAMALFGEKYGDEVRMISIEPVSRELCGGTHIDNTGEIGLFLIKSESSVGSGLRRIEAITGMKAWEWVNYQKEILDEMSEITKGQMDEIVEKTRGLISEQKELRTELDSVKRELTGDSAESIMDKAIQKSVGKYIVEKVIADDIGTLRQLNDALKSSIGSGVILLISQIGDKIHVVGSVTNDLVEQGLSAGELVKSAAGIMGGSGGGRPDFAQGGGKDPTLIDEALDWLRKTIEKKLENL